VSKLDELERLNEARTQGPWHVGHIDENLGHVEVEDTNGLPVMEIYHRRDEAFLLTLANNASALLKVASEAQELYRELKGSTPADIVGNGGAEMIEDLGKALAALDALKQKKEGV
jgi:hypothetical protein